MFYNIHLNLTCIILCCSFVGIIIHLITIEMEKAFKVFKSGVTKEPITILKGSDFNDKAKRAKYLYLGYTITEIN